MMELQQENTRYLKELRHYQDVTNSIDEQSLVTVERFFTCVDDSQSRCSRISHFHSRNNPEGTQSTTNMFIVDQKPEFDF